MDFRKSVANGKNYLQIKRYLHCICDGGLFHPHAGYLDDDDVHHCFFEADK